MTLVARLPDSNELIKPAVLVMTGKASAKTLDKQLKGGKYYCPFCEGWREDMRSDVIAFDRMTEKYAAFERMEFNVGYRCASYTSSGEVKRFMNFAHPFGVTQQLRELGGIDIHQGYNNAHDLAVLSFVELLRERFPSYNGYRLEREKLLVLNVPPMKRRPDIVVYEGEDVKLSVEVQLSLIALEEFRERSNNLLVMSQSVEWFIHGGIYSRMADHRRWMSDQNIRYYKFWEDDTGKLHYNVGEPPHRLSKFQKLRSKRQPDDGSCTTAKRIGLDSFELEQEARRQREKNQPPNIQVGKPVYSPSRSPISHEPIAVPKPNLPAPPKIYKLGDVVEVDTALGWEQGKVINLSETGLPTVQIAGSHPRQHKAWDFEYVRASKPISQPEPLPSSKPSSNPFFQQGSLF